MIKKFYLYELINWNKYELYKIESNGIKTYKQMYNGKL